MSDMDSASTDSREPEVTTDAAAHADITLNASEALYGFCGWLTSRKEVTPAMSERIVAFCDANNLPPLRDGWLDILKHPKAMKT